MTTIENYDSSLYLTSGKLIIDLFSKLLDTRKQINMLLKDANKLAKILYGIGQHELDESISLNFEEKKEIMDALKEHWEIILELKNEQNK